MKKLASHKRKNKKTRTNKKMKKQVTMNINNKASHNREVSTQLQMCEEFVDKVNDTLNLYGSQIDRDGAESLGSEHKECIRILDTVDSDLKEFDSRFLKIADEANTFIKQTNGEAYEWTSTSIGLCTEMNSLRDEYMQLFMLNQQALADIINAA